MLVHWIWFAQRNGIGCVIQHSLLERFADPEAIYNADVRDLASVKGVGQKSLESLQDKDLNKAMEVLRQCRQKQIHILTYADAAYPKRLRAFADMPTVLYYKGVLPDFDFTLAIGVVGTRDCSQRALDHSRRLGRELGNAGAIIVSGAATGIDGSAMNGALEVGAPVVGVLGCGADVVYPMENRELYEKTQRLGCLITEYPPGTSPNRSNFPRRNRIISALSCGVIVVEAPIKSGALYTADYARDQGRELFAIRGDDMDARCRGSNRLLMQGAMEVRCTADILHFYEGRFSASAGTARTESAARTRKKTAAAPAANTDQTSRKTTPSPNLEETPGERWSAFEKIYKKPIDKPSNPPYSDHTRTSELPLEQRTILEILQEGPLFINDIMVLSGFPASRVLSNLTLLEMNGWIRRLKGNRYELVSDK